MGIYYSSISKRTFTTAEGIKIAFTNFYGKAPSWRSESNRLWNSFCTRAENTADQMNGVVEYVTTAKDMSELKEDGYCNVAAWSGRCMLDDLYWDKNICGIVFVENKKLKVLFGDEASRKREEIERALSAKNKIAV